MKMTVLLSVLALSCALALSGQAGASEPKPVYGPQAFTREVAGPDTFSAEFEACDPAGTFTLVVDNGGPDVRKAVSSATVYVNGAQVIRQSDLNQKVTHIERPLTGLMKQNTIQVRMQSAPGSTMTVSVLGVMNCGLKVEITSPVDGSLMNSYGTVVTGTVEARDGVETGVTVNGIPAEVSGTSFAAAGVPLAEGENTIKVVATDEAGNTAEDTVTVTVANPEVSPLYLSAYPAAGQSPLDVKLEVSDAAVAAGALYELDYEGDGVADVSAQDIDTLLAEGIHVYGADGLYFPTVRVTGSDGHVYSATAVVNVFPMPDLGKKWDGMRAAIESGNVEPAVAYFSLASREGYRNIFKAFADAGALAGFVAGLGEMQIVSTSGNTAEGDMRVFQDGKEYSFYVLFVKDDDGIWRIKSF